MTPQEIDLVNSLINRRMFTKQAQAPVVTDWQHLQQALIAAAEAFSVAFLKGRPASGAIRINGKEPSGMSIAIPNDETFTASVQYEDKFKDVVPENAPTIWSVVDANGEASALAAVTVDPDSDQKVSGTINAGSGTFKLRAIMGNLQLESDELDITPGAPSTGEILVTPVAVTPQTPNEPPAPVTAPGQHGQSVKHVGENALTVEPENTAEPPAQ